MKTAFYWPAFLGPLGQQADFWAVVQLLLETLTASHLELFLDKDAGQPALQRLFEDMREGRVNRLVVRGLYDLCLTLEEFTQFVSSVTEHEVKVEQIIGISPSILLQGHAELLGRFRYRQRMAKILRLHRLGFTIYEISAFTHATPQQVFRALSRPR